MAGDKIDIKLHLSWGRHRDSGRCNLYTIYTISVCSISLLYFHSFGLTSNVQGDCAATFLVDLQAILFITPEENLMTMRRGDRGQIYVILRCLFVVLLLLKVNKLGRPSSYILVFHSPGFTAHVSFKLFSDILGKGWTKLLVSVIATLPREVRLAAKVSLVGHGSPSIKSQSHTKEHVPSGTLVLPLPFSCFLCHGFVIHHFMLDTCNAHVTYFSWNHYQVTYIRDGRVDVLRAHV